MILLLLAGCQPVASLPFHSVIVETAAEPWSPPEWRQLAAQDGISRLDRLNEAWAKALGIAHDRGLTKQIAAEGALLDPESALPMPAPSPGPYRCRTLRLGGEGQALASFKRFFCHVRIDEGKLSLIKQTGSARPAGFLFEDGDRLIFLGSAASSEEPVRGYGEDPERNLIGVLERVGEFRWRLTLLGPAIRSTLEIIELVPAQGQP